MAPSGPGRSRGSGSQDQEHVSVHPLPAAGEQAWEEAGQANGHDILIAGWHIPSRDVDYHELGADYFDIHAIDPAARPTGSPSSCTHSGIGSLSNPWPGQTA